MKMQVEVEAPLLKLAEKKYNAIIFSHGIEGHMHSSSILCKYLASQGYIVFSLQHNESILMEFDKD